VTDDEIAAVVAASVAADALAEVAIRIRLDDVERIDQYIGALCIELPPHAPVPWRVSPSAVLGWLNGEDN
jgi:hypothetical protein